MGSFLLLDWESFSFNFNFEKNKKKNMTKEKSVNLSELFGMISLFALAKVDKCDFTRVSAMSEGEVEDKILTLLKETGDEEAKFNYNNIYEYLKECADRNVLEYILKGIEVNCMSRSVYYALWKE